MLIKTSSSSFYRLLYKYRWQIVSVVCSLLIVLRPTPARANIFNSARQAMSCMISQASTGGGLTTSTVLSNLPAFLFTGLTIVLFGYFCFSVFQGVAAYGRGEEVSNVIQQPIFTFISVIIIVLFQSLLFGSGLCGTTP